MRDSPVLREIYSLGRSNNKANPGNIADLDETSGGNIMDMNHLKISVHNNLKGLENTWRELEARSHISIYQRFDWISSCIQNLEKELNSQALIVCVHCNDKLDMILPLAVQNGFIRRLRWIGGNHSNYNMALVDHDFADMLDHAMLRQIFRQLAGMLPGIGFAKLCCQPGMWNNANNPLLKLEHQLSTNNAFAMDLSGGFQHHLNAGNGKRKRKKFRNQTRAAEKIGGIKFITAKTKTDVHELLDIFHAQKSKRLKDQGFRDVFGGHDTQLFLQRLAIESLSQTQPLLQLFALKIGGEIRAICGGGINGTHFSAYFMSFSEDEFSQHSPGEMLLYMIVENLCHLGIQSADLGPGEERYKRSWCPQVTEMYDVILPFSTFSHTYIWAYRLLLSLKRHLRKNQKIWLFFKRTRAFVLKQIR